jgi:hypothetical protein
MPPKIATAEAPQPLSASERETMEKLLARASAGQGPSARIGDPYIALINLSVPRRGDPEKGVDLVPAGETVYLTPDEAAQYLRHGPKDGRQVPVIRPASGPGSSKGLPQRIPPIAVSGKLNAPPPPPDGSDLARPDPPGSSVIQYVNPSQVPEAAEPQPGTENWDQAAARPVSAEDIIPPRVQARQQAQAQRG